MKKYITLAALLAVGSAFANAASLGYNSMTDAQREGVVFAWDFSGTGTEDPGIPVVGAGNDDCFTVEDGKAVVDRSGTPWTDSLTNNFSDGNFTFSLDVNSFTASDSQTLVALYSVGGTAVGETGDSKSLQIGVTDGGELSVFNKGYASIGTSGNISTGLMSGYSGDATVTVVSDMTNTETLSVYVDGELKGSHSNWTASTDQALMWFQIGAAFGGGEATISNITLWNKALSASEVSAIVIPEPSAFGMLAGLGALVLVASRRRRK
ncbi:MAG: PEP-CTERM sorting domain-containing protein [Opitutales bacterium]|nr:PEP-CTERM sorting domain-containing protein [Opitutales bacterium]